MNKTLNEEIAEMHRQLNAMPDDELLESDESRCFGCGGHCDYPGPCPARD